MVLEVSIAIASVVVSSLHPTVAIPSRQTPPPDDMQIAATAQGSVAELLAEQHAAADPVPGLNPSLGGGGTDSLFVRFRELGLVPCFIEDPFNVALEDCPAQGVAALWSRIMQTSDATATPVVVLASDVAQALASGSGALRQPPGDQVLLSKPLIVYTDPSVRTLTAAVGGVDVELSLTPVSYTWDWGDGTSTTTTDPGDVYPNQSVTHYYGQTASGVVVSVTTTWDAVFRPVGAAQWQPVVGQVTTTDEATPFDIVRRVTVLTDTAEELQGH